MCGRYNLMPEEPGSVIRDIKEKIEQKYGGTPAYGQVRFGEIFPSAVVPVLANNRRLERRVFLMRWGMKSDRGRGIVINARSESAFEKPMFRNSMIERRCIVPATNYFEWEHRGKARIKYAIHTPEKKVTYMAGIYRIEKGETLASFVILTKKASSDVAFIHDRMPLILDEDDCTQWLRPDGDAAAVIRRAQEHVFYRCVRQEKEKSLD